MLSIIELQTAPTAPHFLRDTFVPEDNGDENVGNKTLDELTFEEKQAHQLPTFDENHGEQEILYLPPLLSSLPAEHGHDHEHDHKHESDHDGKEVPLRTETHLPSIDPVSLSLHRALHKFKPLDSKYASTPYGESFNWAKLDLPLEEEREWYCVAFRSRRKAGSESGRTWG